MDSSDKAKLGCSIILNDELQETVENIDTERKSKMEIEFIGSSDKSTSYCSSMSEIEEFSTENIIYKPVVKEKKSGRGRPAKLRDDRDQLLIQSLMNAEKKRGRGRPAKMKDEAQLPVQNSMELENKEDKSEGKSALELMRERNILLRKNLIKDCGLLEAKEAFEETLKRKQGKGKEKVEVVPALRKRSRRSAQQEETVTECVDDVRDNDLAKTLPLSKCVAPFCKPGDVDIFVELAKVVEQETVKLLSESELSSMQFPVMKARLSNVQQNELPLPDLPASRFISLAFHPSTSPFLLASGNMNGNICMWNVETPQLFPFHVHSEGVTHLQFGQSFPHLLYSSFQDGSLKCLDINKRELTLCYKLPRICAESRASINWHAQASANVLVAATSEGQLLRLDTREGAVVEYNCHEKAEISTVDIFGGKSVLTASKDGSVCLWDLSYMGRHSPKGSTLRGERINSGRFGQIPLEGPVASAFFSVGGSRLLVTTRDRISVFDHAQNVKPFKTFTGTGNHIDSARKSEPVPKAFWHPMRNDVLVVGGAQGPVGGIHIFHAKHSFKPTQATQADFVLKGACTSRVIFHPSELALASCTASKVHVFN